MSWFYRHLVRPILFEQDSESIHDRTVQALAQISGHPLLCDAAASFLEAPELRVELFGLPFPNPVGLAAGMDKHAAALPAWAALGFGFVELGGITWHAQPGNPRPRIFRAIADEALVNRMGFNNPGAAAMAEMLAAWRASGRWPNHPVGINLGKSKITPLDQAAEDYAASLEALWPHGDFFVINVSSPNTPNLRELQDKSALDEILAACQEVNQKAATFSPVSQSDPKPDTLAPLAEREHLKNRKSQIANRKSGKPILVKVAPDLSFEALDEILELVESRQIAGIIATNTTITRPQTDNPRLQQTYAEGGGLSGRPLRRRSTEVVRHICRQSGGALPVIGVGGIFNASDAWDKITAGASLVQIYTGLVYEGPGIAKQVVTGLRERLRQAGIGRLRGAVGIAVDDG